MSENLGLPETIQTIPAGLAFWAERTPDAPALRSIDWRALSHRELEHATIGVVRRLRSLGVAPEDRVAFVVPPGFETCVAMLGAMIAPAEIDGVVLGRPAVSQAAGFSVPDARLGEDIVVAVVLKLGVSATARELRAWMLDRLTPARAPRRVWFVDDLPRTQTGKAQRGELSRRWREERG